MNFSYSLLFTLFLFGIVLSEFEDDEEYRSLHELAKDIMKNLQKDHLPTDNSNTGAPDAPLHHLHKVGQNVMDSQLIDKTEKIKISVGVKGVKFVSVHRNGKFVNISTDFGVGAVAIYTVNKANFNEVVDESREEYENEISEESTQPEVDRSLEVLKDEFLEESLSTKPNETKVILSQKASYNVKVEPKSLDKPSMKVRVDQGYVVVANINVTQGSNDFY